MKKDNIDKGFEFFYNNLSNRRKFIRTLWLIPIGIALGIVVTYINLIVSIFYWLWFLITAVHQLKSTYLNWQKEVNK